MKELIKKWLPWINVVLLLLVVYGSLSILGDMVNRTISDWLLKLGFFMAAPGMEFTIYLSKDAINAFGGELTPFGELVKTVYLTGVGMLLLFIISPFWFSKGYKKLEQTEGQIRGVGWYIGSFILLSALLASIAASTVGTKVYMNSVNSAKENQTVDELRSVVMNLALDAAEIALLPQERGGGNGSFTTIWENGEARNIKLKDLPGYADWDRFDFVLQEEISDSSITIIGITDLEGKNPNFENANGQTGKIQVSAEVTPHQQNIFSIRSRVN